MVTVTPAAASQGETLPSEVAFEKFQNKIVVEALPSSLLLQIHRLLQVQGPPAALQSASP